jgi:soluble lytic murein transglycosylase-like protein
MDHANNAPSEIGSESERRAAERRHLDRRTTLTMGGRRYQEDRRRHDRRVRMAGAGLLAAAAFAVGGHEIAARMGVSPSAIFAPPSEPEASVDVATDFHLPAWDKAALEPFIQEAATRHGMSATLIRAVIQTESRFNPLAVSRVGAQGLMQLMPETARHVGIENPFDPRENILGGTKYLSSLLDRFKGNTARALAAYNAGPTVVARHRGVPPFRETQGYVRKIQKLVDNTDAEFTLPASAKVRTVALRSTRPHAKRHVAVKKARVSTTRRGARRL